ncbi:MAG: dihydropteroate synthase [Rhodothermales bacterium]
MEDRFILDCKGIPLDCRPGGPQGIHVMGILNVTPDSFSDGGIYIDISTALRRTEQMLEEGAKIIDIGGESTRPRGNAYGQGADIVTPDQERSRVLPVIEAIQSKFPEALISIDTYKPDIAKEAIEAGAHIINDITGLRLYPETAKIAQSLGVPLILMHSLGQPGEMPHQEVYSDVVVAVKESLARAVQIGEEAGLTQMVTDPGFGFGKTPQENLALMNHVDDFLALGYPVLVGISRKSSIGVLLGNKNAPAPVNRRLFGTLGATAVAVLRGATIVRTHDVQPTVEMLKILMETAHA